MCITLKIIQTRVQAPPRGPCSPVAGCGSHNSKLFNYST